MTEQTPDADRGDDGRIPWSAARPTPPAQRLEYEPPGYGRLLMLHAANTALTLVTFSIWRFWAITRVRRVLWAHIRFDGAPLEYTGTGIEIFVGFLKVVLLILLPAALILSALNAVFLETMPGPSQGVSLVYVLGVLWLMTVGKYLSLRYRASRTRWHGIRGRLAGTVGGFLWLSLWTTMLTVLTLSLFKPWKDARRIRYALHGARAGNLPVVSNVTGGQLFWSWLVAVLLWPFSFGLSYFWYKARVHRIVADQTTVGALRFGFTASGWSHAWLSIGNALLIFAPGLITLLIVLLALWGTLPTLSLGENASNLPALYRSALETTIPAVGVSVLAYLLVMPVVWERRIRFVCRHLVVLGSIDLAAVRQAADDPSTAGEGLLGDFDAF